MKELVFEELTPRQKLGIANVVLLRDTVPGRVEYVKRLIKEHCIGAVWIQFTDTNAQEMIDMVRAEADYPILIITDAESGIGEYTIGRHNAIACTGDEKYAYAFGKATAVKARKMGYNVVCNPLLDINSTGSARSFGPDKYTVAKFAAAEARGMKEVGMLTVGKHYPSPIDFYDLDSHMATCFSMQTKEELLDHSLYAYKELMNQDLLDGLMVGHIRCKQIDPDRPSSLSKPVVDIIRKQGFDGFLITDSLSMMGIRAEFGDEYSAALSIQAGCDLSMSFTDEPENYFEYLCKRYEEGLIPDDRLDEAVRHVLAAQHKTTLPPKCTELTPEEDNLARSINKDGVYAKVDDGVDLPISKDGKHLFVLVTKVNTKLSQDGRPAIDTFSNNWHKPNQITELIMERFPNSEVFAIYEFPTQAQNIKVLQKSINFDDVIFVTFSEHVCYLGREHLTRRLEILIEAFYFNGRLSTLVHFGNPTILGNLPHIKRVIIGGISEESANTCIEVLAGEYPAKGKPTYEINLK